MGRPDPRAAALASVALEDQFVKAGSGIEPGSAGVWRVVRIFEGAHGVAYAHLVNAMGRSLTKTVAAAALLDRSPFRPASWAVRARHVRRRSDDP